MRWLRRALPTHPSRRAGRLERERVRARPSAHSGGEGRWPRAETGGVLVGWSSPLARRLVIVDLIDAPKDSRRTAAEFLLGVTGLPKAFAALAESSAGLLRCIGTWHSHLGSAAPSPTDKNSARVAGACDAQPLVFLISGVDGLRAISAAPEAVNAAQADEKGRV